MTDDPQALIVEARTIVQGVPNAPWEALLTEDVHGAPIVADSRYHGKGFLVRAWKSLPTKMQVVRFIARSRWLVPALADALESALADTRRARRDRDCWRARFEGKCVDCGAPLRALDLQHGFCVCDNCPIEDPLDAREIAG